MATSEDRSRQAVAAIRLRDELAYPPHRTYNAFETDFPDWNLDEAAEIVALTRRL